MLSARLDTLIKNQSTGDCVRCRKKTKASFGNLIGRHWNALRSTPLISTFVREAPPFCHTAEIQSQNPTKLLERIHDIDDKPTTIRKSEWIVQRINVSVCPCINSKRIGFNVPFDPWVIVPEDVVVQPRFGIEVLSGK